MFSKTKERDEGQGEGVGRSRGERGGAPGIQELNGSPTKSIVWASWGLDVC